MTRSELPFHDFLVEEYKPNAFEIAIGEGPKTPGPAHLVLPVSAKYYMGKPLSKAQGTWSIQAWDEDFAPEGFDDYEFGDAIQNYELRDYLGREPRFSPRRSRLATSFASRQHTKSSS